MDDSQSTREIFRLSPRTVLRMKGPDRQRYLNGQVTQDVRLANESQAVYACVLNAKGQLQAVCHIREHEDSYLLDAPLDLRDELLARLDRYIIADDVELTDESDLWHVAHIPSGPVPDEFVQWRCSRFTQDGVDLFIRTPDLPPDFAERSQEEFAIACTSAGVPQWGAELTPGLLPPEARLDLNAISYDKGCYIGQEVISRIKHAGKTNQHLVLLEVPSELETPALLNHEGREAGRITSVVKSLPPTARALGFRRRKFSEIDRFDLSDKEGKPLPGIAIVHPFGGD